MNLLLILQASNKKSRISSKVTTSPPNLGRLSPPIVTLTSGFRRPPARPPSLWLPQLAGWTPPAPCAHPPPAAVESPIAFSWCPTPTAAQCFPASEKPVGHVWAVSRTYPPQLNCTDSRPRARWYQLRGLPLADRPPAFPFIFQELNRNSNRKSGTPVTAKSPTVKSPIVQPQRYSRHHLKQFSMRRFLTLLCVSGCLLQTFQSEALLRYYGHKIVKFIAHDEAASVTTL